MYLNQYHHNLLLLVDNNFCDIVYLSIDYDSIIYNNLFTLDFGYNVEYHPELFDLEEFIFPNMLCL